MKPILEVCNISKKYALRADQHRSYALKDLLLDVFGRKVPETVRKDEFYAVKDVSFNLYPGDSIGLIGRNGSGKSTTLRVCAGLIRPNAGKVIVRGKIQALISLGAGFNPALNGLDNIRNAAAILGLTPRETKLVLGEIVEFAELGEFIESPVSSYSSGMYARLGFSVAVHLKPDIIFIDEILGVGDFGFQNKCFLKMSEIQRRGVTIVLVSHSHNRITQMCEKAIWLKDGVVQDFGESKETVDKYINHLNDLEAEKQIYDEDGSQRPTLKEGLYGGEFDGKGFVKSFDFSFTVHGQSSARFEVHDPVEIEFEIELEFAPKKLKIGLVFYRADGVRVAVTTSVERDAISDFSKTRFACKVGIPDFCLRPGSYVLVMPVQDGQSFLYRMVVHRFVINGPQDQSLGFVDIPGTYTEI